MNVPTTLDIAEIKSDASVSQAFETICQVALKYRASDIHIEPQDKWLFVRFRIDGVLQTIYKLPPTATLAMTSRLKILANLDIAEKRMPQDGQIRMPVEGRDVEFRLSTLPGKYGEKVVLRVLDKSVTMLDLSKLGMDPKIEGLFERFTDRPQGMILVTGPTGSGKTTTLYSVLNHLRSPSRNIITLEDPIEYELSNERVGEVGITQVQMNSKIGLTFAHGLRASLRQDPDVIMVGEIRDQETAEVAMKAALTGHLVLASLHTNNSSEAVTRLRDIGIEPYLIASTVLCVMAQRLLRKLCPECKEPYTPPERLLKGMFPKKIFSEPVTIYRPKGCEQCHGMGYLGRMGIYELLVMSEQIALQIQQGHPSDQIRRTAEAQGQRSLRDSGLDQVLKGQTTVEEVFRNTVE